MPQEGEDAVQNSLGLLQHLHGIRRVQCSVTTGRRKFAVCARRPGAGDGVLGKRAVGSGQRAFPHLWSIIATCLQLVDDEELLPWEVLQPHLQLIHVQASPQQRKL